MERLPSSISLVQPPGPRSDLCAPARSSVLYNIHHCSARRETGPYFVGAIGAYTKRPPDFSLTTVIRTTVETLVKANVCS